MIGPSDFGRTFMTFEELVTKYSGNAANPTPASTANNKPITLFTFMKVNSVMGLLLAVEAGVGLAALPEYLVTNSSNVIKVLPKSEGPITEAHFVYPQSLKNTARVQAFRNFLFSKIGDWNS